MSDGVYLLKNTDGYRVGYVNRLESLYKKYNKFEQVYTLDAEIAKSCFGESPVFKTREAAIDFGLNTLYKSGMSDGVGFTILDASEMSFKEVISD